MYSDTHFHFHMLENQPQVLTGMAEKNCFFGLDIGTHCDDLASRQKGMLDAIGECENSLREKIKNFIYFSAGIWPAPEAIRDRVNQIEILEKEIKQAFDSGDSFIKKVCAIGECGLDHHWNPAGVDARCESDFDAELYNGEKEMFLMQLALAKKYSLPVIVHSRDAFEGTIECIKDAGYDNGIIHCYSYGLEEAKVFLDRGWYLAFGGGVTYTKKAKMDEMIEMLKYIPEDRLLLETDAPYLAPVPFRGTKNTPLLIEHSYRFIAEARGIEVEKLCQTVDKNIRHLFSKSL